MGLESENETTTKPSVDMTSTTPTTPTTPTAANVIIVSRGSQQQIVRSSSTTSNNTTTPRPQHKRNPSAMSAVEEEKHIQIGIQHCHIELLRQSSMRSTKEISKDDLHSRINHLYSKFLVDYHWLFLLAGVVICLTLTGTNFIKQPLPDFSDPKRGFNARGEGTLTSQLIVLKNINTELTKYHKHLLDFYEKIKNQNHTEDESDTREPMKFPDENYSDENHNKNQNNEPEQAPPPPPPDPSDEEDETDPDHDNEPPGDDETKPDHKHRRRRRRRSIRLDHEESENEELSELLRHKIYKKLTGHDILNLMDPDLAMQSELASALTNDCNYTLLLNTNLEFYFGTSHTREENETDYDNSTTPTLNSTVLRSLYTNYMPPNTQYNASVYESKLSKLMNASLTDRNLLELHNLRSLCHWDKHLLSMVSRAAAPHAQQQPVCYVSLPFLIALMAYKTDCEQITNEDVHRFLSVMLKCYPLQRSGLLFAFAEEHKPKPEIIDLLNKNAPIKEFMEIEQVKNNWCFWKDLVHAAYEHILDKDFLSKDSFLNVKVSSMIAMSTVLNPQAVNQVSPPSNKTAASVSTMLKKPSTSSLADAVYHFYMKNFHMRTFDDHVTEMIGLNLAGIRESAAMRLISQEMMLVAIAITLIVIVTLLYLRSIFISMVVNLGVGMSVGVAFFAYRIVFGWDLFPFINMMAVFLLIGIACDNVYVLFDSWYAEKARVISEDLPEMIKRQWSTNNLPPLAECSQEDQSDEEEDIKSRPQSPDHSPVVVDTESGNEDDERSSLSKPTLNPNDTTAETPQVKVINASTTSSEQLLPPIYVKRKKLFWEEKSNKKSGEKSKKKNLANGDGGEKAQTELFLNEKGINNVERKLTRSASEKSHEILKNSAIYTDLVNRGIDIADYELNPAFIRVAPLTDEQMVRVMGGTLRHAASSIFVTSFTTAAAFFTNYITKLPSVQLFGIFTGICILIYFCMVITMVASFVITYEKFIQPYRCKVKTSMTSRLEAWFDEMVVSAGLLNNLIIGKLLPMFLVKARVFLFLIFLGLGIGGMLIVFHHPKLKPPASWRHEFFKGKNLFENFEFKLKDEYMSYVNDERRNLTNPEIFFVFGIKGRDTGRLFNPDDDGHLIYDKRFDFIAPESQLWLNHFINSSLASRRDLFLPDELVNEWIAYLSQMQNFCYQTMNLTIEQVVSQEIHLPYERKGLAKCRDEINAMLMSSSVEDFESLMSSFPRRIIFVANATDVTGVLLRINANRTFYDFDAVGDYYHELKNFHDAEILNAPPGFDTGWFISVAFALYDLQNQLITGTYSSLVASMLIALITLLLTSGNILISLYAIVTISFTIADTIAIFVLMGWDLNILESIVIIMSVGLSVDFSCHYGVAYINSDHEFEYDNSLCCNPDESLLELDPNTNTLRRLSASTVINSSKKSSFSSYKHKHCSFLRQFIRSYKRNNVERFMRINDIFRRVGSAVLMAAFTTFLAGFSMFPSRLTSFSKMGQFLMLVMFISYLYATFFFVPLCALGGPTKSFGNLNLKQWAVFFARKCCKCKCGAESPSPPPPKSSKSKRTSKKTDTATTSNL